MPAFPDADSFLVPTSLATIRTVYRQTIRAARADTGPSPDLGLGMGALEMDTPGLDTDDTAEANSHGPGFLSHAFDALVGLNMYMDMMTRAGGHTQPGAMPRMTLAPGLDFAIVDSGSLGLPRSRTPSAYPYSLTTETAPPPASSSASVSGAFQLLQLHSSTAPAISNDALSTPGTGTSAALSNHPFDNPSGPLREQIRRWEERHAVQLQMRRRQALLRVSLVYTALLDSWERFFPGPDDTHNPILPPHCATHGDSCEDFPEDDLALDHFWEGPTLTSHRLAHLRADVLSLTTALTGLLNLLKPEAHDQKVHLGILKYNVHALQRAWIEQDQEFVDWVKYAFW